MVSLLLILLLLAVILALAANKASSNIWIPSVAALLLLYLFIPGLSWFLLSIFWFIFILLAAFVKLPVIRRRWLTKPMLSMVKQVLPPLSKTEREAIEAGDVTLEGDLFQGKPDWQKILDLPSNQLTKEEQAFLDYETETLCQMINDWQVNYELHDLPEAVWAYIKANGFFAMSIEKRFGGKQFSAYAQSAVIMKIASRSTAAAISIMVPNALGPGELLTLYGTDEQKQQYLPKLASAEEIPCFALTSTKTGSDASAMEDVGIIESGVFEGKEIVGMRLTFDKRYITLAPIGTVLALAFKLYDPEHFIGEQEDIGITLCLLPTKLSGIEVGSRHNPMGLGFMNGPVRGKDIFVPLDWIIGGIEMRGKGWRMLMECLSEGRGISLPALATAAAKLCYRTSSIYSMCRRQFRLPIGHFEGVGEALSRIGGLTYLAEATRLMTVGALVRGHKPAIITAMSKYHLTEIARMVCNHALDIHAGRAVQIGPRNYLVHLYHALPVSITVEGANILTRNMIVFGQGAIRCHPFLRQEIEAVDNKNQQQGLLQFDGLLIRHIGYAVSNFARTLWHGLTGGLFIKTPVVGGATKYYRQLTRMSCALALVSDVAMLMLGGELKRKERLSARLGDVLSYLYMATAVLKYFHSSGSKPSDQAFVDWAVQYCLANIQVAFDGFCFNFPYRVMGYALRWVVFPWGRAYRFAGDDVDAEIVAEMLQQGEMSERLLQGLFMGKGADDVTGRVEAALAALKRARPAQQKIDQARLAGQLDKSLSDDALIAAALEQKIIIQAEANCLREYEQLRYDVLLVDEFTLINKE